MELPEIQREALALSERDRATLAATILETLPPPGTDISDEEVDDREKELESGRVMAMSHDDFVRTIQHARGK